VIMERKMDMIENARLNVKNLKIGVVEMEN
jgi:hypothetical protein